MGKVAGPDAGKARTGAPEGDRSEGVSSTPINVLDSEPGRFQFARWKNVTILAWAMQGSAETIQRLARALETSPGGMRSIISVVADNVPPPTPEARAALVALLSRSAPEVACMAVVTIGTGFGASAQRSVHTGVRMDSSRAYEMALFGSIEEIGAWLPEIHEKKSGVRLDPAELVSVVQHVHREACRR